MLEHISQFKEQINLVLGAVIAYGGFYVQGRVTSQQARSKLLLEKIERCYTLCQLVYDGHKREISNANKNFLTNREVFMTSRKHPGQEMSELKMLIRCYAPDLKSVESALDKAHKPLKDDIFSRLDKVAVSGEDLDPSEFSNYMSRCHELLEDLAKSTAHLKMQLAERATAVVK